MKVSSAVLAREGACVSTGHLIGEGTHSVQGIGPSFLISTRLVSSLCSSEVHTTNQKGGRSCRSGSSNGPV